MSLPPPLLSAVAGHRCFTGCYRNDPAAHICVDPALPLSLTLQVVCSDCLSFRVGAVTSALPSGMSSQTLADELSAHVRGLRGFVWATSGYSMSTGFWLSAAYYGRGLFLADASRNGKQCTDLDVLISAFQHGVVAPEDPQMLLPSLYNTEVVYLDMAQPITQVRSKKDLLASPRCRSTRAQGHQRVTILEFMPLAFARPHPSQRSPSQPPAPARAATPSSPRTAVAPRATSTSDTPTLTGVLLPCPRCGADVKERPLFSGTFVGCLC